MIVTILVFILILTALVLIHEAGHFIVAKMFNIKVEEFGFGFPPRVWGKKRGETLYSINALPIGGFVKLYGEDEAGGGRIGKILSFKSPVSLKRAFFTRPAWQRALVVVAGVVMNFLLSVVLLSFLFAYAGVGVAGDKVTVEETLPNSPARAAGIAKGDIIESVNGIKITSTTKLLDETKKYLGQKIDLKIKSKGIEKDVFITPRTEYPKNEGPMGIVISQNVEIKKYPWYEAPIVGTKEAIKTSFIILSSFWIVIYQLLTQGVVPKDVAGPVGIAQLTGQVVHIGPFAVASLISLLSLNLAILNVLPIPALDGGRLFFILIEVITRKKIHPKFESYAHAIGMALLLALIVLITIHDLTRVLSGQPILPTSR